MAHKSHRMDNLGNQTICCGLMKAAASMEKEPLNTHPFVSQLLVLLY